MRLTVLEFILEAVGPIYGSYFLRFSFRDVVDLFVGSRSHQVLLTTRSPSPGLQMVMLSCSPSTSIEEAPVMSAT